MKKYFLVLFLFLTTCLYSQAPQDNRYQFYIDLNNPDYNQLDVELITPAVNSDKAVYKFPAMVPGTYKVYDFGRFISGLKAFDKSGNELATENKDVNSWEISDARDLYKIKYRVRETFGDTEGVSIFEPAGTCIQKDTVFVFNNQGFFGYLDGYLQNNYTLTFKKPENFYGSTSLDLVNRNEQEEIFSAENYQDLVDNPILFCVPDTITINFDESKILLSVYSPGKGLSAKDFSGKLTELLSAIRKYLGGKLPAEKYSFLYFFSAGGNSHSFGALEHNYSSLYYMPDVPKEAAPYMIEQMQSTSAHEFYHIVTPLHLHSEEIGIFDFNNPKMSEHLWLYEGVTEYHADYIRLREGIINFEDYLKVIQEKLNGASRHNDTLPFTELSKGALDKYEPEYINVYQKGALIGLCLDILIRKESDGKQGIQDVINKLSEKYGRDKPFKDEELFSEIENITSPKVGEFLKRYVAGPEKIPYNEILNNVGIKVESNPYNSLNIGGLQMGFNQKTYRLVISSIMDTTRKLIRDLGLKTGDELVSINGKPLNFMTIRNAFGSVKNQFKVGDKVDVEVARSDENGNENILKLSAVVTETKVAYENIVKEADNLSDQQRMLRKSWTGF